MKYLSYEGLQYLYGKILTRLGLKVDATNGDISSTKISTFDILSTEFPVPAAGESTKTVLGKIKKFITDFNSLKSSLLLLSMLTSQYENNTGKIPTAALVYALKQSLDATNSNLSVIGDVSSVSPPSYVSCDSGISKEITMLTLPAGVYVISASLSWSDTIRGGGRRMHIRQGDYYNSLVIASDGADDFANDAAPMEQSASGIVVLPTGSNIKLWATQTSGSNLSVGSTAFLKAVRIK